MKTKLIVIGLVVIAILWTVSVQFAYDRGYRQGGDDERACWTLEPSTTTTLLHGGIVARRVLKNRIDLRGDPNVNSIPAKYLP